MLIIFSLACQGNVPSTDDVDGDGVTAAHDCDDTDPSIHPDAEEICDGIDNNCDGAIDDLALITVYEDHDSDGYGDPDTGQADCAVPEGFSEAAADCDDGDSTIHPGAEEVCDGIDNNCDGAIDDLALIAIYEDHDGDGYGDPDTEQADCAVPEGHAAEGTDCDDGDATVHPGAAEVACDGIDNNCTEDSGGAVWHGDDGTETDLSAVLSEGFPDDPVLLTLTEPGVLRLCEGHHAVSLMVEADVAVEGLGASETWLVNTVDRAFTVTTNNLTVALSALSVAGTAGGVRCEAQSTLSITDAQITGGVTDEGGGIYAADGCAVSLSSVTVFDNSAGRGGALFVSSSTASVNDSVFTGNDGSALYLVDSHLTMSDTTISDSRFPSQGGALFLSGSTAEIDSTTFFDNHADAGGALHLSESTLSLTGSALHGNSALNAGAVDMVGSTLSATSTSFYENVGAWAAYTAAGGLRLQTSSHASLTDCTVQDNVASWGGGLWLDASSSVDGARVDFITNHPDDLEKDEMSYVFHKDATFSCAAGGDECD